MRDSTFIWMAVVAAVLGFFFAGYIARFDRVLLAMEALAMGLLASVGADSALRAGLGTLSAIVVGTIVATAGSLLRDILGGDAPQLLRPGVFLGVIALSGSILYVLLESMISEPLISQIVVIAVVFAGRLVAVRLDLETRPAADLSDRVWSFWDRRKGAAP